MSELTSAPPPSSGITWADHNGKLLIIEPLSVETGIKTVHGDSDAVKANVHVITGPSEAEEYLDCLVFPKILASQLRTQIGKKVVGRLSQGVAKPGQSAPWLLDAATEDDLAKAQAWLDARKPSGVTSAAAPF